MTWYEWGFESLKILEMEQREKNHQELQLELTGQIMALIANVNRDPKKTPMPFTRKDFFKLSYDTQLIEEVDPELFKKVAQRLGGTIKKKDSGQ